MSTIESNDKKVVDETGTIDYNKRLNEINQKINDLVDKSTDNDESAKEELNKLNPDFLEKFINSLTDAQKNSLKFNVKQILDSHKDEENFETAFKGLVDLAEALKLDGYIISKENPKEDAQQFRFQGELDANKIDKDKDKKDNISTYIKKDKPENEDGINDNEKLYNTIGDMDGLSEKINTILKNEEFENNDNLKKTKTLVDNINGILSNLNKNNIQLLQKYIFENLENNDKKEQFKKDNYYNEKSDSFDGRLGRSTLGNLNDLGKKINDYVDSFNTGQIKPNEGAEVEDPFKDVKVKESEQDLPSGDIVAENLIETPDGIKVNFAEGNSVNKDEGDQRVAVVLEKQGVNSKEITVIVKIKNGKMSVVKEETQSSKSNESKPAEPLKIWNDTYQVATTEPANKFKGGTLYYPNIGDNAESQSNVIDKNGDREYLMQVNGEKYIVKVDQSGNLCPTAINKISNVPVVMENSDSGKAYIANKLPNVLKGRRIQIGWNGKDYTIALPSGGKFLTIEPMTIDGKWIGNLTDSLAFLNLTNYLRNSEKMHDIEFKDDNPELKLEGNELYVRVKKTRDADGKKVKWLKINKDTFGLPSDTKLLKKYISYNDGKDWDDKWDKKKPNKYYKSVKLQ